VAKLGELSPVGPFFSLGNLLKINPYFCASFSAQNSCELIVTKMGWATLLAIFSQIHMVSLPLRLKALIQT
jgi:hypothetical protein